MSAHLLPANAHVSSGARLELTGSSHSGLALKTSDVNVNLFVPDRESPFPTIMALKQIIEDTPEFT